MNIYFACSITGGREFEPVFQAIVTAMLDDGHDVPTAHLATPEDVYARDVAWIRAADVLVAEVSTPSHGVGYEIGFALGLGKPALACHRRDRNISKLISENPNPNLLVGQYETTDEAIQVVRSFLSQASA